MWYIDYVPKHGRSGFDRSDLSFIKKLDYERFKGQKYQVEILSDRYLSIDPVEEGFDIGWVLSDEPLRMSINDTMLSDWLDHPTAYGAFEDDRLIGFVEGFLEKWNNRYRISNICVFDHADRRSGDADFQLQCHFLL